MKIQKTTTSKNLAKFNLTAPNLMDGQWVVVTAYSRSCDDQGMYTHSIDARDATDAEILAARIADSQRCGVPVMLLPGWETLTRGRTMTTKTRTEALAFALRLSIDADTNERSQQASAIAKQLATGMTAKQIASVKQMAAIV